MIEIPLEAGALATIGAAVLAWLLEYAPGVSDWFETLDSKVKALTAMGIIVVVGLFAAGWACLQGGECLYADTQGIMVLASLIVAAIGFNYGAYGHIRKENFRS